MRRLSFLYDLPVILGESGTRVGRVLYVRLDESGQSICGVGVKAKGIFPRRSFIPMEDIGIIGDVSVIVRSRGVRDRRKPESHEGKRVISTDGEWLGWMTNIYFDNDTGAVEALEVSQGFFDDIQKGRLLVSGFTIEDQRVVINGAAGIDPRPKPSNETGGYLCAEE